MTDSYASRSDRISLILRVILAVAFLGSGIPKLLGVEQMQETFAHFGYPIWFATVIGLVELACGIGLLFRRSAPLCALTLGGVMLGAVGSHLLHDPPVEALPAAILGVLLALFLLRERRALLESIGR